MNNEQLLDWLCELHEHWGGEQQRDHGRQQTVNGGCTASNTAASSSVNFSAGPIPSSEELFKWRPQLQQLASKTNMLLNYFICNFDDPRLSEPLITQLLALYYRLGVARCFVLQLVPTFIHSYLKALTKRWSASARMLEMFFLAIYNEEILAAGPGTPSMAKRTDKVRLPSLRRGQSISKAGTSTGGRDDAAATARFRASASPQLGLGHTSSAVKIQLHAQQSETVSITKPNTAGPTIVATTSGGAGGSLPRFIGGSGSISGGGGPNSLATTSGMISSGGHHRGIKGSRNPSVRIGPFPAFEKIIIENRFVVLTRLMRAVNQLLPKMAPEVVCRALCQSLLYICRSGFSFQETDFRQRVLREWATVEVYADFSRKSRLRGIPSHFLVESMNGLNYALLNGHADVALRALDAVHQRAQYEMMADVLLETNSLRHCLSDPRTVQAILLREEEEEVVNDDDEESTPKAETNKVLGNGAEGKPAANPVSPLNLLSPTKS